MKHTVYREQLLNTWIQFISGQFGLLLPLGNVKSIKLLEPVYESAVPKVTVYQQGKVESSYYKVYLCDELHVENPV